MQDKLADSVMQLKTEAKNILLDENHPLNAVCKRILKDPDFMTATVQLLTMNEDSTDDVDMALDIILKPTVWNGRILGIIGMVVIMLDLNPNEVK